MATEKGSDFIAITLDICRNLDVNRAMAACFAYLGDRIPLDTMYLQVYESDLSGMKIISRADSAESKATDILIAIPEDIRSTFEQGLKHYAAEGIHAVAIINDPGDHSASRTLLDGVGEPISSILVMMLVIDKNTYGSLVCIAHGVGRYTEAHRDTLATLYEPFLIALSNSLAHREIKRLRDILVDDNRYLQHELDQVSGDSIVGAEFGLKSVINMARQVARHESPVLITGETGTGKDLVATAIHRMSPRSSAPFIRVNCGAIPESLVDSELFGHEKGAFTGAISSKRGRFERANGGTIFLDEVGELPSAAQVRLLRVLQNREIERVGGTETIPVDIRVLAATNRDLGEMVDSGAFREDLWFRLCVFPIEVPALRERRQDIPALVYHFLANKCRDLKIGEVPTLGDGEIDLLMNYRWPGNVRELENIVERALILHDGRELQFSRVLSVPQSGGPIGSTPVFEPTAPESTETTPAHRGLDAVTRRHIENVLNECGGKIHGPGGAAEILAINPSTLRNKMVRLGIVSSRN